ncbi:hypothetical protein AURDEDRAFT_166087 [Auricularia subglabra TFB-10046 SS5]|nr:hypothetical protein AURDEDRAFT_166087 [Auricularia subglabra TFB-10046 SS5]
MTGIVIYSWPETAYIDARPHRCSDLVQITSMSAADGVIWIGVPGLQFSVFWVVEVVLQTRIFALYRSWRLAILNMVIFALEIPAMVVLWLFSYTPRPVAAYASQMDEIRSTSLRYNYFALYWLPGIAFELWLATLAIRKLRPQVLKNDLLSVIVHDSIRYFLLVAVVMVLHVVATFRSFGDYAVPFVIAGQTIGGSRLVLHLRRAYFLRHDSDVNVSFAVRMTSVPVARNRFVDESFYVQEHLIDKEEILLMEL